MKKTVEISNARELYEYALKLLGYRNYSEEGLRKKLQVKSNDQEAITQTIKKLVSFNLLNEIGRASCRERVYVRV